MNWSKMYGVPNLGTALSNSTPHHIWFTVIDLANVYFCLPLDERLQPIFAFTLQRRQYTYSRMPQGLSLTPDIFKIILKTLLQETSPLPEGRILVQ